MPSTVRGGDDTLIYKVVYTPPPGGGGTAVWAHECAPTLQGAARALPHTPVDGVRKGFERREKESRT